MRVLVTGGLGYIGSHTVVELLNAGHEVTIIDNLVQSDISVLDNIAQITNKRPDFFVCDIRDKDSLRAAFAHAPVDGVIHFAALKIVSESFEKTEEYFSVNVEGTRALCEVMEEREIFQLVYSSSAAVYGVSSDKPITESAELLPANPYGETKVAAEKLLSDLAEKNDKWSIVMLRYFNPVGAHESGLIGDAPKVPTGIAHMLMEVVRGARSHVVINGDDYETPDGTPVRDYIHVVDLAEAHINALEFVGTHTGAHIFNVGTGKGYSVKELIHAFEVAANKEISVHVGDRRVGDVMRVVADPKKIQTELGWHATRTLDDMAKSSVVWSLR